MNATPMIGAAIGGVVTLGVVAGITYYFTPEYWEVGYEPDQPVDYNHQLHAGTLGIDCRYCHTYVEDSGHANVPDTATCMNCHTGAEDGSTGYLSTLLLNKHKDNPNIQLVRSSYASGEPIAWKEIHKLPDYAHFNHSVHVNAGVSCYVCHGRMDRQEIARQEKPLSMAWCLECHRDPGRNLVDNTGLQGEPVSVFDLGGVESILTTKGYRELGDELAEMKQLDPPRDCGACHY
jgi:hypothetical protein